MMKSTTMRLFVETRVHEQPLIYPQILEVTASQELTIIDNMSVFLKNGFHITVDPDALPGQKLKLVAVPFSKKTQFSAEDIRELADNLTALGESQKETIRPKKIEAMFASRACRKSIMVGRALERSEQIRVVRHLATMDQPWNCPHGRPTLQHMFVLR